MPTMTARSSGSVSMTLNEPLGSFPGIDGYFSTSSTASMQSAIFGSVIGWRARSRSTRCGDRWVPPIPQGLEGAMPSEPDRNRRYGSGRVHACGRRDECNCPSLASATRIQWGWGLYRSPGEIRAATSSGRYWNEPACVLDTHDHQLSGRRVARATGGSWRRVLCWAGKGERLDSSGR